MFTVSASAKPANSAVSSRARTMAGDAQKHIRHDVHGHEIGDVVHQRRRRPHALEILTRSVHSLFPSSWSGETRTPLPGHIRGQGASALRTPYARITWFRFEGFFSDRANARTPLSNALSVKVCRYGRQFGVEGRSPEDAARRHAATVTTG
jgi:hypothetical protein